jgi:hypothetical protein
LKSPLSAAAPAAILREETHVTVVATEAEHSSVIASDSGVCEKACRRGGFGGVMLVKLGAGVMMVLRCEACADVCPFGIGRGALTDVCTVGIGRGA